MLDALVSGGTSSSLTVALREYLRANHSGDVYSEPSAFEAFIDNGTNPDLYEATVAYLGDLHRQVAPESVLDVGCGDGRVAAAVVASTARLDLVDPSEAMLATAVGAVGATGRVVESHANGIEDFLAKLKPGVRWDVVQSTFALHNVAPDARHEVLSSLAERTDHLVVVEFDAPDPTSPGYIDYLADRYELGVQEYGDYPDVISGFLMPVLVGQLQPGRPRHTHEQPVSDWVAQCKRAGYLSVTTTPVFDYWWAPAVAIHATHR